MILDVSVETLTLHWKPRSVDRISGLIVYDSNNEESQYMQ